MNCPPSGTVAPDAALDVLTARLRARLHGRVGDFHLVGCAGGVILRGYARTYYAKQLAQHALMEATNLRIVANEIQVG